MPANEQFNFGTTPYAMWAGTFTTDGTTDTQLAGASTNWTVINGGDPILYAEPEKNILTGNRNVILDRLTRLILIVTRSAGTGTWIVPFRTLRGGVVGSGSVSIVTDSSAPLISAPRPLAFDNPLVFGAAKSKGGGEAMTDPVTGNIGAITPGSTTIAVINVTAFLVPGFVDGSSNKGANLSAPQYLTYR